MWQQYTSSSDYNFKVRGLTLRRGRSKFDKSPNFIDRGILFACKF